MARQPFIEALRERGVIRAALLYLAAAFAVLEFADIAFPRLGLPDEAINLVLWLGLLGLPVVLTISWKWNVRVEHDTGVPIARSSVGTIAGVIALVAVGVFLGSAWDDAQTSRSDVSSGEMEGTTDRGPMVAVLRFTDRAGSADLFAAGLSEEIGTALAGFAGLRVVPPSGTRIFEESDDDPLSIAAARGVDYVLRGTVQRSGDALRVGAQLVDVRTRSQLWGDRYTESADPALLFETQDEIASRVASAIGDASGVVPRRELRRARSAENSEAYRCVLKGQAYLNVHSEAVHSEARTCLERAIEIAPDYADAWAHLAYLYREEFLHRYPGSPRPLDRALAAARRAIALDPNNAMGHFALSFTLASLYRIEEATEAAERLVLLAPNDTAMLGGISIYLAYFGRFERAIELADRVERLNPLNNGWTHYTRAVERFHAGDYEAALMQTRQMRNADVTQDWIHLVANLSKLGRMDEARAAAKELIAASAEFREDPAETLRRVFLREASIAAYSDALRAAGIRIEPGRPAAFEADDAGFVASPS